MPPAENEQRSSPVVGIILALGAVALLLMLMLFKPRTTVDLPIDQGPIAMALVNELMTNGVLVDYDCLKTTAWVNRAVWANYNVDQQRNMVVSLATVCERQRGTYRISIVDYDSKRELASFDGKKIDIE
jgi:hypothetical protein